MISKYGASVSKAVGLGDVSLLVVKKSHYNKKYSSHNEFTNFTKQNVGPQYHQFCNESTAVYL